MLLGIGCFEETFKLKVKEGSQLYHMPPRRLAYTLQEPLKEELERLWGQQLRVPLGTDETSEWHNSFISVPKANGKVKLCLNLARLNNALIRPTHRGLALSDILPRLAGIKYITLVDVSLGYHNLRLDDKLYLTTFNITLADIDI